MARKARKRITVYAILWNDAVLSRDDDIKPRTPVPALTFGTIINADEKHATISGEVFADNDRRLITSIPSGMSVRVIKIGTLPEPVEFEAWRKVNGE